MKRCKSLGLQKRLLHALLKKMINIKNMYEKEGETAVIVTKKYLKELREKNFTKIISLAPEVI